MLFKSIYLQINIRFFAENNTEAENQAEGGNSMASQNRKYGPDHPWTKFKMECATDLGRTQFTKENNDEYKGNLTSRENGSQGGPIGGEMVKRMIAMAKQQKGI